MKNLEDVLDDFCQLSELDRKSLIGLHTQQHLIGMEQEAIQFTRGKLLERERVNRERCKHPFASNVNNNYSCPDCGHVWSKE